MGAKRPSQFPLAEELPDSFRFVGFDREDGLGFKAVEKEVLVDLLAGPAGAPGPAGPPGADGADGSGAVSASVTFIDLEGAALSMPSSGGDTEEFFAGLGPQFVTSFNPVAFRMS